MAAYVLAAFRCQDNGIRGMELITYSEHNKEDI